eukprot:SAG31_NODE_6308_length_2072_cov_1.463254_3_plen_99_part_00
MGGGNNIQQNLLFEMVRETADHGWEYQSFPRTTFFMFCLISLLTGRCHVLSQKFSQKLVCSPINSWDRNAFVTTHAPDGKVRIGLYNDVTCVFLVDES